MEGILAAAGRGGGRRERLWVMCGDVTLRRFCDVDVADKNAGALSPLRLFLENSHEWVGGAKEAGSNDF